MLNLDERYRGCLAHLRFLEEQSLGRRPKRPGMPRRPAGKYCFADDALRVGNCDAFFREHGTTQVFIALEREDGHKNDRLLHSLEVAWVAKAIASFMGLNASLTEANGLGHDTGHSPFGHFGEETISDLCGRVIDHRTLACLILQHIEYEGRGLDLTYETLLGIYHHSGTKREEYDRLPQEFCLVYIVDKIYMFADIEDGLNLDAGFEEADKQAEYFGRTKKQRLSNFANALVKESVKYGKVSFWESDEAKEFWRLRDWMYENCYKPLNANREPFASELARCYEFLNCSPEFAECDPALLLALMNDHEVHRLFKALRNKPKLVLSREAIKHLNLSISRIYPHIRGWSHNLEDPDLDWGKT